MFAEFVITDGTTTLDFLGLNGKARGPYGIARYTPGRPNAKGGGSWQDSPLARGRRLAYVAASNVDDVIELKIAGGHSEIINAQQELDLLLEKAIAYWTADWQDEPVYIRARAAGEDNSRYAIIYYAAFPEYPDPYQEPFVGKGKRFVMDGILLGIERGPWLATPPGVATAVEMTNEQNITATTDPIHITNHYARNDITAIWLGQGGGNQINDSVPFTLFESFNIDSGGNAVYFGSAQPFHALLFDIGQVFDATDLTITWEYSTAATTSSSGNDWGDATGFVEDGTNGFLAAGPAVVRWTTLGDDAWAKYTVAGIGNLYWIRARVSSLTMLTSLPTQITRQVYVPYTPYVTVAAAQVAGDINALARVRLTIDTLNVYFNTDIEQIFVGLRSTIRGSSFTAYISPGTDNPSGVSIDLPSGATLTADQDTPYGQYITWTSPDSSAWKPAANVQIDTSIVRQFYGEYRLFVRCFIDDSYTDAKLRYRAYFSGSATSVYGEIKAPVPFTNSVVDLGYVQLPPTSLISSAEDSDTVVVAIEAKDAVGLSIYDVILLPTDEWAAQIVGTVPDVTEVYYADVDSIGYPKKSLRGILRLASSGSVLDTFQVVGQQQAILAANVEQKLWVFMVAATEPFWATSQIEIAKQQRYHHLRGD